jgi:hypothetical protein
VRKYGQPAEYSLQRNKTPVTSIIHFSSHSAEGTAISETRIEVDEEENYRDQIFGTTPTHTWSDLAKPK